MLKPFDGLSSILQVHQRHVVSDGVPGRFWGSKHAVA